MVKVQQKFFKTSGSVFDDAPFSLSTNCQRVFIAGDVRGVTSTDFACHVINTINASNDNGSDAVIAGLDRDGCQKFFKTAGQIDRVSYATDIIADCKHVFVVGAIAGPTAINFAHNEINVNSSGEAIFLSKLDNCGHQKFFITAGNINTDGILPGLVPHITKNCERLFVSMPLIGSSVNDFNGNEHLIQGNNNIGVAGIDYKGNQKFFVTAGSLFSSAPLSIAANDCATFVTGYIGGPTALDFNNNVISLYGNADTFVAGLSNCGTQKFFKHAGTINSNSRGTSIDISCDDLFITGIINGSATAIDFKGNIITTHSNNDIYVAKLNCHGEQKFFKTAGGLFNDSPANIISNEHGVFVTGFIRGPTAVDFCGREVSKLYGSQDIFVAALSRCGKQTFFKTAGSRSSDTGIKIAANDQAIFVTGVISGPTATDFNGCPVKHLYGLQDIFVAKLDYSGHQDFFVTAGGSNNDQGIQIEIRDNEIYVAGIINGSTGSNFCNHSVKHLNGETDIFVARLDDLCGKYRSKLSTMPYVPR